MLAWGAGRVRVHVPACEKLPRSFLLSVRRACVSKCAHTPWAQQGREAGSGDPSAWPFVAVPAQREEPGVWPPDLTSPFFSEEVVPPAPVCPGHACQEPGPACGSHVA